MLGKMLIHGLVGAAVIASAAAVFAQAKDNGYLKPDALPPVAAAKAEPAKQAVTTTAVATDNRGYIVDRERTGRKEHHHDGRRHHDDDDD